MAKSPDDPSTFIAQVRLVGRSGGGVKALRGFDKSRHNVPDAVNSATSGFLAKLCAEELAEEAEQLFQRARQLFGYKRKQISLDVASPVAVLVAKDFTCELSYALNEARPAEYDFLRQMHEVKPSPAITSPEMDELFAGSFDSVVFSLRKGVKVEAVIDAVEELDGENGLQVDYPSDCRECTLTVEGVDEASVVCDGASLEMRFSRGGSPRELIEGFVHFRRIFALSKSKPLAGLL